MINQTLEILTKIEYPLIGLFILFLILSILWKRLFQILNLEKYHGIQRVHENEVPRLGGLLIYLFLFLIYFVNFDGNNLFFSLLTSVLPIVLVSIKEDFFHNTNPQVRLCVMVTSCLIFFYINPIIFPVIDLPFFGDIVNIFPISIIFFIISSIIVINGMNLIDGMNGLFGFTALIQLSAIAFIALEMNNEIVATISIIFLLPLVIFLLFNFPFGFIFIGDLGAYLYGFVISILTIYIFGNHQELFSWSAVLLLFYPCFEIFYSFIRKTTNGKSPLLPDNKHIHTNLFYFLTDFRFKHANPLSTIIILIFIAIPTVILSLITTKPFLIPFLVILFSFIYHLIYRLAQSKCSKN